MSTVTEPLVAQPLPTTTFLAKRVECRLVKKPTRQVRNADGDVVDTRQGQAIQFVTFESRDEIDPETGRPRRYGRFDCPLEGTVKLEGDVEVDAAEVHEWLMRHRMNGNLMEGFWVMDRKAPPVTTEETSRLMAAAFEEETLVSIISQEEAGWQRDEILSPAREALERLRQLKAEANAQPEPKPAARKAQAK